MPSTSSAREQLRKLLRDDPRAAILLRELLGPPPALRVRKAEEDP